MILRNLFEPILIKNLRPKNRIIMSPMHNNLGNREEGVTDRVIDFYAARAKGGFGTIGVGLIEAHFVAGASSEYSIFLENDKHLKNHMKLIQEVKKYGVVVYAQISARRIWPIYELRRKPRLSNLPQEKIEEMVDSMIRTAVMASRAGYDAISIHGIGGSAVSFFLSKVFNDRTDGWGGTLEARLKFPIEIIKGIRKQVGKDYPLFFRMHGSEFLPGGYGVKTQKIIAQSLVSAGVDLINVSGGSHATSVPQMTPEVPRGAFVFSAREIKSAVNVPVAYGTRINDPLVAEDVLRKGWADMISLGRPSLADAEWPNKARRGDFIDIRYCIACNECLDAVVIHDSPICCTVNPRVGKMSEIAPLSKAAPKKKVLVVGGGCTGLQAALTCAERGHKVTLVEKEPYLGGKWTLAAVPPGRRELLNFLLWLVPQVKKAGVDIRTEIEFAPELAQQLTPDTIIDCTGSKLQTPKIPGIDLPNVVTNEDVLNGNVEVGERVVIVGGGGVGVETAIYLARKWSLGPEIAQFLLDYEAVDKEYASSFLKKGHQVTVVEQLDKIAEGVGPSNKWVLRKELSMSDVQVITKARVKEIKKDGVVVEADGTERLIVADTVVLATGFAPDTSFYETIKNLVSEVYVAGNAAVEGHTIEGIRNAFEVAMKI